MNRIRVLIADDHILVREGLRLMLEAQGDIVVVGEAGDGVEALELASKLKPEVVLLDIAMPRLSGLETVRLIREAVPESHIIVLSMYDKEAYAHQVLQDGAHGYVLKGASSSKLLEAIRAASDGRFYFGNKATAAAAKNCPQVRSKGTDRGFHTLSDREKQVFFLLLEGNTSPQISKVLCVSQKTLEKHRASVCRKLGINSAVEMMKYAIRQGFIDPGFWKN
ncbi:MAG TPA: response regulator transcription factor [Desulfuromonadales bacterium]|nr:response regulator transcription factor [Desulfuromonadales bacterium]